jgi:hypothetical protein
MYFLFFYLIILLIIFELSLNIYLMFYGETQNTIIIYLIKIYFIFGHLISQILFIPILSKIKYKF